MARILPLVIGLGILMGSELFHGRWTDRWSFSGELERACAKFPPLDEPMIVGDWRGQPADPIPADDIALGEIAGYINQVFTHPSGAIVHVLVVCGRPGPIAVHTPEVCLGGEGCVLDGEKRRYTVDLPGSEQAAFWVGQFYWFDGGLRKDRRTFWTYSPDGKTWTAEDNPRLHFARYPLLYKIYLMRQLSRRDVKLEEDPTNDFIKVFLPELQKRLQPR